VSYRTLTAKVSISISIRSTRTHPRSDITLIASAKEGASQDTPSYSLLEMAFNMRRAEPQDAPAISGFIRGQNSDKKDFTEELTQRYGRFHIKQLM
jgi:hypothetical protein